MNRPDARRVTRDGEVRRASGRAGVVAIVALLVTALTVPALAEVTQSDIRAARTEASKAAVRLEDARDDLASARRRLARVEESLDRVAERLSSGSEEMLVGRNEARERIARMYMTAGGADRIGVFGVHSISDLPAHSAYLGALAEQDREFISRLAASQVDLGRLRDQIEETRDDQQSVIEALAGLVDDRYAEYEAAEARVAEVEAQWQRQEEERRRREEEERRRRAEEERRRKEEEETRRQEAQQALAAAAAVAAAAGWKPGMGVEPWRPLVVKHFPERLVEEALRVMRCESAGNPLIVNKYSGAAGLFQHLPYYWPSRAARAGWPGADIFDPEANIAVSAWLVRATEQAGKDSWAHWTCKP